MLDGRPEQDVVSWTALIQGFGQGNGISNVQTKRDLYTIGDHLRALAFLISDDFLFVHTGMQLLVYEYIRHESLEEYLFHEHKTLRFGKLHEIAFSHPAVLTTQKDSEGNRDLFTSLHLKRAFTYQVQFNCLHLQALPTCCNDFHNHLPLD